MIKNQRGPETINVTPPSNLWRTRTPSGPKNKPPASKDTSHKKKRNAVRKKKEASMLCRKDLGRTVSKRTARRMPTRAVESVTGVFTCSFSIPLQKNNKNTPENTYRYGGGRQ